LLVILLWLTISHMIKALFGALPRVLENFYRAVGHEEIG